MRVTVVNLGVRTRDIPTVGKWLFQEWGHLSPGKTVESSIEGVAGDCGGNGVPSVYAAVICDKVVGTVSLVEHDMAIRKELTPWVASVFVHPAFRRRGVGRALMQHIDSVAADLRMREMFLFTPNKQRMYARLGWREKELLSYRGEWVTIMEKEIGFPQKD